MSDFWGVVIVLGILVAVVMHGLYKLTQNPLVQFGAKMGLKHWGRS